MNIKFLLPAVLLLTACQTTSLTEEEQAPVPESDAGFTGQYTEVDEDASVISFVGKSSIIDHEGKFNEFSVDIETDVSDPSDLTKGSISVEIEVDSVETDSDRLDGHLQRDDFFDAENHPTVTFVTTSITSKGDDVYTLTGEMTAKGVTQTISFDATITDEALTGTFDFPREDFGIGNDTYGEKLLDETVPVTIKLLLE